MLKQQTDLPRGGRQGAGQRRISLCWVPQPILRAGEVVSEGVAVPVFKTKSLLGGHEGGGDQVTLQIS